MVERSIFLRKKGLKKIDSPSLYIFFFKNRIAVQLVKPHVFFVSAPIWFGGNQTPTVSNHWGEFLFRCLLNETEIIDRRIIFLQFHLLGLW